MENKYIIIIMIVVIAIIITTIIFLFKTNINKSPSTCETVLENNGTINIVFLSNSLDKSKALDYVSVLGDSEPFSKDKDKFNFYYAGETKCETYQNTILFCYSSDTIKTAAGCKDDFIVVLSKGGNLRSSSYGNLISLNVDQSKNVFLHEFGHAFANLADEYVPSEIPRGSQNCQKSCNFAIDEGCFQGCSKNNYYRSIDSSIMKTLSTSNYGKLNTQIIENEIEKY